jgi:hypothetical protein
MSPNCQHHLAIQDCQIISKDLAIQNRKIANVHLAIQERQIISKDLATQITKSQAMI